MAQGTLTLFEEFAENISQTIVLKTDTIKCMLIDAIPTAADLTPDSGDYTQVTGTNYTAGGETLTVTWTEVGGVCTFDSSTNPSWTKHASGPSDIKAALIYSTTASTEDAIGFIDMTADGSTAISLIAGDIDITFGANIFTLTIA